MSKSSPDPDTAFQNGAPRVVVSRNGPYLVGGNLPLAREIIVLDDSGDPVEWAKGDSYPTDESYELCRCGQSKSAPFCSGSHLDIFFDGRETAVRTSYMEQARRIEGPDLVLADAKSLCAVARFCHRAGGTWQLTADSDRRESKETAIQQACDCPSGRLVTWGPRTANPIEPAFKPSISLVEDPQAGGRGPIWLKGGVPVVSADGTAYEVRNRVTLCRCGKSKNKPFCDGSHTQKPKADP